VELKVYFYILKRKWWIVVPTFLVTVVATIALTFSQQPVYRASATYVVTPSKTFGTTESFIRGLDLLSRRAEIAATYVEVASSHLIRKAAADALQLTGRQRRDLRIEAALVEGTNVIRITVESTSPAVARDMANMVGLKTIEYVQTLYETYGLKPLDTANLPKSPSKPRKVFNLGLASVLGLFLGVGLAFLADYLESPVQPAPTASLLDPDTGVHSKHYFLQRLSEEMSRAKRHRYALSVAVITFEWLGAPARLSRRVRVELLRRIATLLKKHARPEDTLAYLGGSTFGILLPDMSIEEAQKLLTRLQTRISWTPLDLERSGMQISASSYLGLAAYQYNGASRDDLLAQAYEALQAARAEGYGSLQIAKAERQPETNGQDDDSM